MKTTFLFGFALLVVCGGVFAQSTYPGGIVYGPKAAFKIDAPPGWVLDNSAGVEQGLPCVLYPKGSTWADANTIMYAKIAGTDYEDVGKFVAMAISQMEKVHGKPKEKVDSGKTGDGQPYFINEYPATKSYSQWERVAYIPIAQGGRLHCVLGTKRSDLSQRFFGAQRSTSVVCLHESRKRSQTALIALRVLLAPEGRLRTIIDG